MIYLVEEIASKRKFVLAGQRLAGRGGVFAALGLFVAGLGYARINLTDGFVDDAYLETFARETHAKEVAKVLSSRAIRLWHRKQGGYQIHDFHDFNQAADKVKRQRELARLRKAKERDRKAQAGPSVSQHVTRDKRVTSHVTTCAPDPTTHVPLPLGTRAAAAPQRDLVPEPDADDHYAVITAVATKDILPRRLPDQELLDATLTRCAELQIACDPMVARKAVDSALFRYYRASRLEFNLPADPRGIHHDHEAPRRKGRSG